MDAFSSLPVSTKNEFDSSVGDILRNLDVEEGNHNVASYMCYLKPIMTFLNYGLIRHLITKFGDAELQQDMKLYIDAVGVFIKDTTIEMVMDCYSPDEVESHINYTKVMITFNRNPKTYSLERLSNFRAKFCKKTQQSEHIFGLIALKVGSSFCATWLIPTVITTKLMEATLNQLDQTFYQEEDVALVSLEGQDSNKLLYISVRCMHAW